MTATRPHPTDTVAVVSDLLARLGTKARASWSAVATTKPHARRSEIALTCGKLKSRIHHGIGAAPPSPGRSPEQAALDALAQEGLPLILACTESLRAYLGATEVRLEASIERAPRRAAPPDGPAPAPLDVGAVVAAAAARCGIRPEDITKLDLRVRRSGATKRHYPACYVPRIGTVSQTHKIKAALEAEMLPWVEASIDWLSPLRRVEIAWQEIAVTGHARMRAAAAAQDEPGDSGLPINAQRRMDAFLKRVIDLSNRYGVVIEPDPAGGARLVAREPNTLTGIYAFDPADGRFLGLRPLAARGG